MPKGVYFPFSMRLFLEVSHASGAGVHHLGVNSKRGVALCFSAERISIDLDELTTFKPRIRETSRVSTISCQINRIPDRLREFNGWHC